ncbi:hypothetical protein R6Z07M_007933 [Ovis aries]
MGSVLVLTEDRQQGDAERRRRHVCCERKQVAGQGRGDVHGTCGEVRQVSSDTAPEAGSKLRVHLDIRVGEHDLDAAITQAKDKVNEVSFKLEHLIEQIEQIVKEQNYQRDREEKFRMTSEDTNSNGPFVSHLQSAALQAPPPPPPPQNRGLLAGQPSAVRSRLADVLPPVAPSTLRPGTAFCEAAAPGRVPETRRPRRTHLGAARGSTRVREYHALQRWSECGRERLNVPAP